MQSIARACTVLLKSMCEAAPSLFSHFLKTDMPGASSQTRQSFERHCETEVVFLVSHELYAPDELSILTQISLGSKSQLTFQADT